MSTIPLDRRFLEWRIDKKDLSDPELLTYFANTEGTLGWVELLKRRRVVILAEAGSGKSEELRSKCAELASDGRPAFYAAVQDVGREGFEAILTEEDRQRYANWRASNEPGYFFIDSIDEAKLENIHFERALRAMAVAVRGSEGRAHIVWSGRHTDWEQLSDLARLKEILPLRPQVEAPATANADALLLKVLHNEREEKEEQEAERPLVVVLTSLDEERVRRFAVGKSAPSVDSLLKALDDHNLWRFARRPLDLDWIVEFWRKHERLGSLTEMLDASLRERLREVKPSRARRDPIDHERAVAALERIGAALVLARAVTVTIPDGDLPNTSEQSSLDLAHVLPDWTGDLRFRLLNRAVFDPATFGRVRLHNDNEGAVRAFLAARWLLRLVKKNLPRRRLYDLLFAESYGIRLIKPSLMETTAWLSQWLPEVAQEIIDREPFVLLTGGDPGSLPAEVRGAALTRVVERMVANDERLPSLDYDSVKRFSRPDMASVVSRLWSMHKGHRESRDLLLRIIWLGSILECKDIAIEARAIPKTERFGRVVAGRAFLAVADDAGKRDYASEVIACCAELPPRVIWDALDELFPSILGVSDLLTILSRIDVTNTDGVAGFKYECGDLIGRVDSVEDLHQLLTGLIALAGPESDELAPRDNEKEETLLVGVAAAAFQLLAKSSDDAAPEIAMEATMRLGRYFLHRGRTRLEKTGDAANELRRTAARRRAAFWYGAKTLSGRRMLRGRMIESSWEMEFLGWSPKLVLDDADWLLADTPLRTVESERILGVNTLLALWRDANRPSELGGRIREMSAADPAMQAAYLAWINPPPENPALAESERELREVMARNAEHRTQVDQSWRDLVAELRQNPAVLRALPPATSAGVDRRLYYMWHLLSAAERGNARYAIASTKAIEPIVGSDVADALREGLIRHWRTWQPVPRSTRAADDRSGIKTLDAIGLAGLSMEANRNSRWADNLDDELARRAAIYATLEIGGLPAWIQDVARRWPDAAREALQTELTFELDTLPDRHGLLYDIGTAGDQLLRVMTPFLLSALQQRQALPTTLLEPLLRALEQTAHDDTREAVLNVCIQRFPGTGDLNAVGLYLGTAFRLRPAAATEALLKRLGELSLDEQTQLAQHVLPAIFGSRFSEPRTTVRLDLHSLEHLVRVAFRTIRTEEDNNRPSGVVYSPDARDQAEHARGAVFKQLTEAPGRAAFNALLSLCDIPDFPWTPGRLRALAHERAARDSESAAWPATELHAFEQAHEALPQTPVDLQRLLMSRLLDLQDELVHGDFQQGSTLRALPRERNVQNWMADRLHLMRGRSFTLEREPHVADEKEPDIRARAANDARVAIEIKVAESWTFEQLVEALEEQLCARYLRAHGGRHGILLLVHQNPRLAGWSRSGNGRKLTFPEVVELLRQRARDIAGADSSSFQPEIAVIDVSTCPKVSPTKRKSKNAKNAKTPKRKTTKRPAKGTTKKARRTSQRRKPRRRSA